MCNVCFSQMIVCTVYEKNKLTLLHCFSALDCELGCHAACPQQHQCFYIGHFTKEFKRPDDQCRWIVSLSMQKTSRVAAFQKITTNILKDSSDFFVKVSQKISSITNTSWQSILVFSYQNLLAWASRKSVYSDKCLWGQYST